MSGGSYHYIQHKDVEDFIDDHALLEQLPYMASALNAEYGDEGKAAGEATQELHDRIVVVREQIKQLVKGLDDALPQALRSVWRQVDYHDTMDVSKDQVIEELVKYNQDAIAKKARLSITQESPIASPSPTNG